MSDAVSGTGPGEPFGAEATGASSVTTYAALAATAELRGPATAKPRGTGAVRTGLPAPTGTVELRGWPDGLPVVVAWIEGRPYWPLDVYQGVDPSDPEALEAVAELLPGPM
ncbi:hypothetical protein [Streptomyces sp. NPDC054771]